VARETNAVFVSLQGLSTLVKQQYDLFSGLDDKILSLTGDESRLSEEELQVVYSQTYEINGSFCISHEAVTTNVSNLDVWVCPSLSLLTSAQKKTILIAAARMYVLAIASIYELTLTNQPLPPITPKEMVSTSMTELAATIEAQRDRLLRHFGDEGIDQIGQDFKRITIEYNSDRPIRAAMKNFYYSLDSFQKMWQLEDASTRFPKLASFCGELATVFLNTATVESDFSLIGCA
jgi:hypothetical protein